MTNEKKMSPAELIHWLEVCGSDTFPVDQCQKCPYFNLRTAISAVPPKSWRTTSTSATASPVARAVPAAAAAATAAIPPRRRPPSLDTAATPLPPALRLPISPCWTMTTPSFPFEVYAYGDTIQGSGAAQREGAPPVLPVGSSVYGRIDPGL